MKAFILAGGLGSRLRPLTETCPKPLLPFANIPLAEHTISLLQRQGINEFVFLLHYKPEAFPPLLGDGRKWGCRIEYVSLPEELGTAGCVKFVENRIEETSLIFSGDLIADLNIEAMLESHRRRSAQITMAIRSEASPLAFGVVRADSKGRVVQFQEKPTQAELFSNWMNCGIYLVEPGILQNFPARVPLSFEKQVFPLLAEQRKAFYAFPLAGYWCDIGRPAAYLQAHIDFLERKLPAVYYQHAPSMISTKNASNNLIGAKVRIDGTSRIERCCIGDGCIIERGAELRDSVLWDGVRVGSEAKLSQCVAGRGSRIGAGAEIFGPSLLAAGGDVRAGSRIGTNGTVVSSLSSYLPTYASSVTVQAA